MPNGKGIAFPDASYNYRRGIRRPVTPANVPGEPEETAGSCGCGGGNGNCGVEPQVYDCSCPAETMYQLCCDENGCCCQYPAAWRNRFWPEFAHPRWLCCKELYNEKNG